MKRSFLRKNKLATTSAAVLCLLVVGAASVYMYYDGNSYIADASVNIGYGGLHREFNVHENLFDGRQDVFKRPIETVEETLSILNLKYGFNKDTGPTLRHRISPNQSAKSRYVGVVSLTVEGDDQDMALQYLKGIVESIVFRQNRILQKRTVYLQNYHESLVPLLQNNIYACAFERRKSRKINVLSSEQGRCNQDLIRTIIKRQTLVSYLLTDVNSKESEIILEPTLR